VAALQRDGLVEDVGAQRDTGGKPARMYGLTREGEELFPKAYALVLGKLLEEITRRDGQKHTLELLRAVGKNVAAQASRPAAGDLKKRVEAAAVQLRGIGAEVDVQREGRGWRLQGYACPFSAVSAEHAESCALAQALVSEIVGQPVRECCERGPRPRCAFAIDS
jgi:predicted ArsR family transcriptional regulator